MISARITALTLLVLVFAQHPASAHRRDEYLQAVRIAIDPDRVEITLDLTPGIAVAESVLAEIDRDRNRGISRDEARTYSTQLLRAIALDVDGAPLRLDLIDIGFPSIESMLKGEGTATIRAAARMPNLAAGTHHLHYRNTNRPDIGVYLANALVPLDDRVAVTAQRRDADQRDLTVDYTLAAGATTRTSRWLLVGLAAVLVMVSAAVKHRYRRRTRNTILPIT
jgi:hypothetical protein